MFGVHCEALLWEMRCFMKSTKRWSFFFLSFKILKIWPECQGEECGERIEALSTSFEPQEIAITWSSKALSYSNQVIPEVILLILEINRMIFIYLSLSSYSILFVSQHLQKYFFEEIACLLCLLLGEKRLKFNSIVRN